ncbi:acid protease [Meredithblackwellia eburnea MCA 4105]
MLLPMPSSSSRSSQSPLLSNVPPLPLLLLITSLLASTSTAFPSPTQFSIPTLTPTPTPTSSRPPPLPPPPSEQHLIQRSHGAGGLHLPIYRNNRALRKRSTDTDAFKSWAERQARVLNGKYGPSDEERRRERDRRDAEKEGGLEKRQTITTALSVAGYGTSRSFSSTTTSSANASQTTLPVGMVRVSNYEADLEYFAPVGVGVPPQYMNVILDTGSADLWIAGSTCSAAQGCDEIATLNLTKSVSAIDADTTFSVRYGSGSASGEIYKDYVGFAGYNVSNQSFALCDTVSNDLINGNISGLMGLGFQTLAASGVTPFWQNLFQAGVLPFPGFAFYLTRFINISSAAVVEPGGQLTFGYLNDSLYDGDIHYVNIPDGLSSYWVIPMDAVAVNGTNVTGLGSPLVAIDTGTTLIGGPSAFVRTLYAQIPGALPATGDHTGYYSYPCSSQVNITFTFGGVRYNMTAADFNLGTFGVQNNVSTCLGAFFDLTLSSTSKISWVIGAAFLKNVFSVFRASPPSVGFATLSNGNRTYRGSSNNYTNTSLSLTQVPNGIYGPSGETSYKAATITTAIQAGQTASRSPLSNAAAMVKAWGANQGGVRSIWTGGVVLIAMMVGVGAIV